MKLSTLPAPKLAGGPRIMGVLNVTPDSFSDGGKWREGAAVPHALAMLEAGADLIDIGGESTRPGAVEVDADEEIARVVPVIASLRAATRAPISIDTMKPAVARAAFAVGATLWNDITALSAPSARDTASAMGGGVILMHMQGDPRTMQDNPHYGDVVAEVTAFLKQRVAEAEKAGIAEIWIDPGIGFGKTLAHNLALLNGVARMREEVGRPIVIGVSRKSFIAKIDPGADASHRLGGSIAGALLAAQNGADMLRVHDVQETVQALKLWRALRAG